MDLYKQLSEKKNLAESEMLTGKATLEEVGADVRRAEAFLSAIREISTPWEKLFLDEGTSFSRTFLVKNYETVKDGAQDKLKSIEELWPSELIGNIDEAKKKSVSDDTKYGIVASDTPLKSINEAMQRECPNCECVGIIFFQTFTTGPDPRHLATANILCVHCSRVSSTVI